MATRDVGVTEGDLSDGVKAGVHALGRAEEPPGQEAEGPYERGSARNGRGAKGPRKVEGVTTADSDLSCLCSLRHCRRWRFRVCGRHALPLPGSLCSPPVTAASSLVRTLSLLFGLLF